MSWSWNLILSEFALLWNNLKFCCALKQSFVWNEVESWKFWFRHFTLLLLVPLWLGLVEDRLLDRGEHLRLEAELSAGVGLVLEPHVVGGEDLDPLGDGVFHGRALTIWATCPRSSQAIMATVILGQTWGAHHRGRVGVALTSQTCEGEQDSTSRNHAENATRARLSTECLLNWFLYWNKTTQEGEIWRDYDAAENGLLSSSSEG